MTASHDDDAAASSTPPLADGGPAASSFPGTPGRRTPEESPMPQHPAVPDDTVNDDTVRMPADGADSRPSPAGGRPSPAEELDATRPVTRDWLLGAPDHPDAAPGAVTPVRDDPGTHDDRSTQALDLSDPDRSAAATGPAIAAVPEDGTATEPVH